MDKFLRFMAVQALIANADGFFTLGYNYYLYLDPASNRFVFVPGDQELAFANFMMMGTADQLMDMSIAHPYGGENRLADRSLAIKDVRDAYKYYFAERARPSSARIGCWPTRRPLKPWRVPASSERRRRGPPGPNRPSDSGPPGGPTAPDLRTFAEACGVNRRSTRRQEGWLLAAVQLRPTAPGCPAQTH